LSSLPNSNCMESNLSLVGFFITTLLVTSDCGLLLRFGIATARIACASTRHLRVARLQQPACEGRSQFEKRAGPSSDGQRSV
jgi:hypothetical protein